MGSVPEWAERDLDLLVDYSLDESEEMVEAVVNAFLAVNIDVFDRHTQLNHWINTAVLENLQWEANRPLSLFTRIWGYPVVMTSEEVRVYKPPSGQRYPDRAISGDVRVEANHSKRPYPR